MRSGGIDPEKGTVQLPDGSMHNLLDTHFPTIDWEHPYELTDREKRSSGAPELSISELREASEPHAAASG